MRISPPVVSEAKVKLCTVEMVWGGKKKREKRKALHSEKYKNAKWKQRVTYKGCWQKSVLSWAKKTRSDPVHMQMRSAKRGEKVRSS